MAKSTFVNRFEALTGGEEGGACTLGVSRAFTLGTGTLPLGILGVCMAGLLATGVLAGGAGVTVGWGAAFVTLGGELGSDMSEEMCAMTLFVSSSGSRLITGAPRGIGFGGIRAFFASELFGKFFFGAGVSSYTGLDSFRVAELVDLCVVFCLFAARSAAQPFSFSFSCRAS